MEKRLASRIGCESNVIRTTTTLPALNFVDLGTINSDITPATPTETRLAYKDGKEPTAKTVSIHLPFISLIILFPN